MSTTRLSAILIALFLWGTATPARAAEPLAEQVRASIEKGKSYLSKAQQNRGGERLRQIGCEAVANRIGNEADGNKTCAETMRESDPALARHLWQQSKAFDPQGDRDEMRHQHQMTAFCPWRPYHRHYGNHHRKQPDRADRHGDRRLHHRGAGAQCRDQDDLRRSRPDQGRTRQHPTQTEVGVVRKRADAEIGGEQHKRENRGGDRPHSPCERPQGTLPTR